MIIDDGRNQNKVIEDVPICLGGIYRKVNNNNYYLLCEDIEDDRYFVLVNVENGCSEYDYSLARKDLQDELNEFYEYRKTAKLSF